jgi:hypothetical protein
VEADALRVDGGEEVSEFVEGEEADAVVVEAAAVVGRSEEIYMSEIGKVRQVIEEPTGLEINAEGADRIVGEAFKEVDSTRARIAELRKHPVVNVFLDERDDELEGETALVVEGGEWGRRRRRSREA